MDLKTLKTQIADACRAYKFRGLSAPEEAQCLAEFIENYLMSDKAFEDLFYERDVMIDVNHEVECFDLGSRRSNNSWERDEIAKKYFELEDKKENIPSDQYHIQFKAHDCFPYLQLSFNEICYWMEVFDE